MKDPYSPYKGILCLITGLFMLLIPLALHLSSSKIMHWLDPVDPVPQNAMVVFGLSFVASLVVCIPLGLIFIGLGIAKIFKANK